MTNNPAQTTNKHHHVPDFLLGGGEMGERIRNFNWSATPLGPPEQWEQSLKTCVRIMLSSSQPIWIGWGKSLIKLYNDPYRAIVGGKHPEALGKPASEVWSDIWKDIEPMLRKVMDEDEGTYVESQLLIMDRNGYPEETYYTFSYTPIPGDKGGTGGMICANTDDTNRIINERSLEVLRGLGKLSSEVSDPESVFREAARVLARNDRDFPFAVFYDVDERDRHARQIAWSADKSLFEAFPDDIDIDSSDVISEAISKVILTGEVVISGQSGIPSDVPKGFWDISAKEVVHLPIKTSNRKLPFAVLSFGINPYRQFNDAYSQFAKSIVDQISIELNNILALEEERKRAKALAEIDKAKTVFFNNISHEFRTPLTLMLGPLEELLKLPAEELDPAKHASIETTHRNTLRLLKLVNTLLDFSRLESGRHQLSFSKSDIAGLTRNLASAFRSIIEKGGLKFNVTTENIDGDVYVDRDMWEKIVFNLLSNAFKFTLEGEISIALQDFGDSVVLKVSDTGAGIPAEELPKMFERFHRIQGTTGRTFEGSGIGLSMIKELVRLHNGTIEVSSTEGKGSTFTVTIPKGKSHINEAFITENESIRENISNTFQLEAESLLEPDGSFDLGMATSGRDTILIVDDNPDMRDYISTLLAKKFNVLTAANGKLALEIIAEVRPSLILSDIMMPVMDGIALLKEIKNSKNLAQIPIILLSARSGEEYRIEGYESGADDYLIKPFSSKELIARINSQLRVVKARQHSEQLIRNLFLNAPVAICIFRGSDHVIDLANNKMLEIWGKTQDEVRNKPVFKAIPESAGQGFEALLDGVFQSGESFIASELPVTLRRKGVLENVYVKLVYEPMRDENGTIVGIMALASEITDQVRARKVVEESREQLQIALDGGEMGTFAYLPVAGTFDLSERSKGFLTNFPSGNLSFDRFFDTIHPDDKEKLRSYLESRVAAGRGKVEAQFRVVDNKEKKIRWIRTKGRFITDPQTDDLRLTGIMQDITKEKEFEERNKILVSLIEESKEFIGITSLNNEAIYANPEAMRVLGWDTIKGKTSLKSIHPDDHEKARQLMLALRERDSFQSEIRVINEKTKEVTWLQWNRFNIKDPHTGKPVAYGTVSTNITERKKNEDALRESEQRFRSLADHSPMIVYIVEPGEESRISYFNKTWLTYTGQDFDQAITRGWAGIVHPDDVEFADKQYQNAFAEKQSYLIDAVRLKNKDGNYRWHTIKSNPRFSDNGEFLGYIGVGFDVHERRLAEESLRESEEQFRTLAQRLPQLIWVTDSQGKAEYTSQRWSQYSETKPQGKFFWSEFVHREDLDKINRRWLESLRTAKVFKSDVRLLNRHGEHRWHSVVAEPVFDNENHVIKWVGAFTDIHQEKTFSQKLESIVEQRTNELVQKNEALEKMNGELESFAYISSHDLQEPLRKIQTFASRIMESEFQALSPKGQDYFMRMENAALRMKTLIEDLLAYSRTSTEDRKFEVTDLTEIVDEIKEEFQEELQNKNAVVEMRQMCDVYIIPFQFRQLLHNLISNSLKFARPTAAPHIVIESEIGPAETFVVDKLVRGRQYCHITISDNGIGFDAEYKEKIFEVFQRLHGREKYSGTGIGLAIVKKIIENHDGVINATGEAGKGATFDIYIPSPQ